MRLTFWIYSIAKSRAEHYRNKMNHATEAGDLTKAEYFRRKYVQAQASAANLYISAEEECAVHE